MKRILIVDDEPLLREMVAKYLKKEGYRVMTASNGFDAFRQLIKERPDILLTDIMMPGMTGFELAEKVQAKFPEVKIILMTGYKLIDESCKFSILKKPFKNTDLDNALSEQLQTAKSLT
jgi:CheY-like chemotaxis protein